MSEGVRLYVGADAQNIQRRRFNLTGYRCFSGAYGPKSRFTAEEAAGITGILDSGAFSDPWEKRLTPDVALERQLRWEREAERWWRYPWKAEAFVSYDLLIDEVWTGGTREKRRWSVEQAEQAVETTVQAAAYLASQRERLAPRKLILAAQGVDWRQYEECTAGVLEHITATDWFGLGGWCILGWFKSWIPQFWATCRRVLPMVAAKGVKHIHIFGVMYRPVLGGLLWLADQHGLTVSTDSSGPAMAVTWKDGKKAGAVRPTWEENCQWWIDALASLRSSEYYHEPPRPELARQKLLFSI